jgi:hypothetical protein
MAVSTLRTAFLFALAVALTDASAQTAPAAASPADGTTQVAVPAAMEVPQPALAELPAAHDGTPASGVYYAEFARDLYQTDPLMLYGIMAERYIDFHIPRSWQITGPVELELRLDHSETLLPERSAVTVMVNNRAVASQFLNADNVRDGRVVAKVDPDLLSDFNQIRVAVVQHYTNDCEDPFDPNLWTRISHDSVLKIPYQRKTIEKDLVQVPSPLFEESGLGPVRLDVVTASEVDAATVEAMGILGFAFGRLADYRGLRIEGALTSVTEAKRHALLVGLIDEQSQIRQLIGTNDPAPGEGLVVLAANPNDPTLAVLVVTARDQEGLRKAAYAVAGNDRHEILSGPFSKVTTAEPSWPETRRDPRPAPPTTRFTLDDLGIKDRSVRGFYADPIVVPVMLEGDAAVRPGGGEFLLDFSYSSQLDTRLSTVEVSIDGVVLISRPLDRETGEQNAQLRVHLPAELVRPHSKVFVQFHLFPESFDACERVSDRIVWGTVHGTSRFELERDHFAEMPDLGRLRYDLWPFTGRGAGGAVQIIAPDRPAADDATAVFVTAAALGWRRSEESPSITATTATRVGSVVPADQLIVLVAGDSPNAFYTGLEAGGHLNRAVKGGEWTLTGAEGGTLGASFAETYGSISQVQNPARKDASILILRSDTRDRLASLASELNDDKALLKIDGNITVVPGVETGEFRVVDNAVKTQVGELPLQTRVTLALARFGVFFGLLLLGAAVLFALTVSLWANRNGAHT